MRPQNESWVGNWSSVNRVSELKFKVIFGFEQGIGMCKKISRPSLLIVHWERAMFMEQRVANDAVFEIRRVG